MNQLQFCLLVTRQNNKKIFYSGQGLPDFIMLIKGPYLMPLFKGKTAMCVLMWHTRKEIPTIKSETYAC